MLRLLGALGASLLCALVLVLASDLRKLGVDLDAALLGSFGSLRKLQKLQLEVVASPLLRRKGHAFGVVALLRIVQLGLDGR